MLRKSASPQPSDPSSFRAYSGRAFGSTVVYLEWASGEGASEKQHCKFGSTALYQLSHIYCSSFVVFLDVRLNILAVRVVCSPVCLGSPCLKTFGERNKDRHLPEAVRTSAGSVFFADNFWLVSNCPSNLSKLGEVWWQVTEEWGFSSPLSEASWCSTIADDVCVGVSIWDQIIKREPRATGFKVLGTYSSFNNRFSHEVSHRVKNIWKGFWGHKYFLLNPRIHFRKRFKLVENLAKSS